MARIRIQEPIEEQPEIIPEVIPDTSKKINLKLIFEKIKHIRWLLGIVLLFLSAFYVYGLQVERNDLRIEVEKLRTDPAILARNQNQQLLNDISKLIELPVNETPTIADVTSAAEAKKQDSFYKDAQNGDKVLFYIQAGKAILYRPSSGKIITTAPITKPIAQ